MTDFTDLAYANVLAGGGPQVRQRTERTLLPSTYRALRRRLAVEQAECRAPSLVAGVIRDGMLVFSGECGAVRREEMDTDAQYRIGSITKTFVAVLVLKLRDEGVLRLEDPVEKYVPGSPVGDRTLLHLLTHGAGLQAEVPGEWWERTPGRDWARLAQELDHHAVKHPAGRRHHYSNPGMALLGLVVERTRGAFWFDVLEHEVLRPLGMDRTTYHPKAPHAQGYAVHPYADVVLREPHTDTGAMSPAGQLWSTLTDLSRWCRFLLGETGGVLSPATVEEMRHPVLVDDEGGDWTIARGLGLEVHRVRGRRLVGHAGTMPGFMAHLIVDVDEGTGAVTLANLTSGLSGTLHLDLLDLLTELEPPIPEPWRAVDVPDEVLEIVGPWYWGTRAHTLHAVGADRLHLCTANGALASRFRPAGDGTWLGLDGYFAGETLRVVRRDDDTVGHLDLGTFVFTRSPYDPTAAIPGGLPEEGWHAPKDTSLRGRMEEKEKGAGPTDWDS